MKFKPFYIHYQNPYIDHHHNTRGFTAYIAPGKKKRECNVQISMCSKKDQFCKKIGREEAHKTVKITCNPRQIAKILGEAQQYCLGMGGFGDYEYQYYYVYKYML
jgi:hypothetical protein